jgi:hypothetical protein
MRISVIAKHHERPAWLRTAYGCAAEVSLESRPKCSKCRKDMIRRGADDYSENRTGRGTEAGTGDGQARGPRDSCLPIRSRPHFDEVRDDAGPGRGTLWGYCPRNRAHHQSLQLTSQIVVDWSEGAGTANDRRAGEGGNWRLHSRSASLGAKKQHSAARPKHVQTADALTGAANGLFVVSAPSISSIVRPRVSKPKNKTATSARTYQAAK